MKSFIPRIAVLLLAALTLLTACTTPPPSDSGDTTADAPEDTTLSVEASTAPSAPNDPEPPARETYEDLSHTVPAIRGADGKSATATARGERSAPDVVLEFNGESGLFVLSPTKAVEVHDSSSCKECGFAEDGSGFFMTTHNSGDAQAGFTVTLASPLPPDSVTGMTVTYRTSGEAVDSVFRVMTHYSKTMASYHSECPSLSGATEDFRTVDVLLIRVAAEEVV